MCFKNGIAAAAARDKTISLEIWHCLSATSSSQPETRRRDCLEPITIIQNAHNICTCVLCVIVVCTDMHFICHVWKPPHNRWCRRALNRHRRTAFVTSLKSSCRGSLSLNSRYIFPMPSNIVVRWWTRSPKGEYKSHQFDMHTLHTFT